MRQVVSHIIMPFITGVGLGMAFCVGLCMLDVGGLWTLVRSANAQLDFVFELVRFASLFGILSVATHNALGLVCDQ